MIFEKDRCVFTNEDEARTYFNIIRRHIGLMPKVYRKRNCNWVIVKHLFALGSGYSSMLCLALNVEPSGYKWEVMKYDVL